MHEEDDVRERDERDLLQKRVPQRVHRLLDEIRPVIEGHDRHSGRKPRLDLGDAGLDRIDHLLGVDAGARDDDAAHCLPSALYKRRDSKGIPNLDVGDLLDIHRHTVRGAHDDLLDVVDRGDQSDAAHNQPGAVRVEDVAAHVDVAVADGGDDRTERQVV